jgi:hypothetical protein
MTNSSGESQSLFSEKERAEMVKDLERLGMSPEQIEKTLAPQGEGEPSVEEQYKDAFFEDTILFFGARRDDARSARFHCEHQHTSFAAATRCARTLGPEWYVVKYIPCGFSGQLLKDCLNLQEKIRSELALPFEKRTEKLSDSVLESELRASKKNIQTARRLCDVVPRRIS